MAYADVRSSTPTLYRRGQVRVLVAFGKMRPVRRRLVRLGLDYGYGTVEILGYW